MTHHRLPILALLSLAIGLASCEIEDACSDYNYDGFWHLQRIDTIGGGSNTAIAKSQLFWAKQHNLLQLIDVHRQQPTCLLRYEIIRKVGEADIFRVYDPYIDDREHGDTPITDPSVLSPYGIQSLDATYRIEDDMDYPLVLNDGHYRLYFEEF